MTTSPPKELPDDPEPALRPEMSTTSLILQALGGLIGLGLLVWCVRITLTPANREALAKLSSAPFDQLLALIALSVVVVLVGGETFRRVLMPVKRLPIARTHATNCIAGLLALIPFKLSIVFRVLVHNRRDQVPLLTIGAWFSAVAGLILAVLAPVMLASWLRGKADALWLALALGGVAVVTLMILSIARWMSRPAGWSLAQRLWNAAPLPGAIKRSTLLDRAHEGLRMLSHPGTLLTCVLLRITDLACQAGRVYIAAKLVGHDLPWDQAALAGSVYFLVGAAAPTGQAGAREGLTAAIAAAILPNQDLSTFALIVLPISASELLVLLAGSILGMPIVRPDKLLLRNRDSVRNERLAKSLCQNCGFPRTGLSAESPCPECGELAPRRA